jgi:glycosyltransferase involved in cell wall biosynthesis
VRADAPVITVIVPCWDRHTRWLAEAVESVVKQDGPTTRVLVVDNASSLPVTVAEPAQLMRLSSRVSLGTARNVALSQTNTDYVLFWDADDVMLPGTLRRLHKALADDPDAIAATGVLIGTDGTGARTRTWGWPPRWASKVVPRPRVFAALNMAQPLLQVTGATLLRAGVVRQVGGFGNVCPGEDWSLAAVLAWRGRVIMLDHAARLYRIHPESVLATMETTRSRLVVRRAVRQRLRNDVATPRSVRALMPFVVAFHWLDVVRHAGYRHADALTD